MAVPNETYLFFVVNGILTVDEEAIWLDRFMIRGVDTSSCFSFDFYKFKGV